MAGDVAFACRREACVTTIAGRMPALRPGGETATTPGSNPGALCGLQVQLLPGPLPDGAGRWPAQRHMPGMNPGTRDCRGRPQDSLLRQSWLRHPAMVVLFDNCISTLTFLPDPRAGSVPARGSVLRPRRLVGGHRNFNPRTGVRFPSRPMGVMQNA